MKKTLFAVALPWFSTLCLLAYGAPDPDTRHDTVLRAEYRPGDTCDDCFGWRVRILESGAVKHEVKKAPGWDAPDEWLERSVPELTQRQMRRLLATIEEVRFGELEQEYSATYMIDQNTQAWRVVTCQDTVMIEARVGNGLKRVKVYGPEEVAGIGRSDHIHPARESGRRFCRVWGEVLNLVRSPNDWQRAGSYR